MRTVNEVSKLTGISVRTLHHYDEKGTSGKPDTIDTKKMDEYAAQAKESWGKTAAYKEFEEKAKNWTKETEKSLEVGVMSLFTEFGAMKDLDAADEKVQAQVKKLQDYFTENFYNCTPQILGGLGRMYAGGGEFTENIDRVGGEGTGEFVNRAIEIYVG